MAADALALLDAEGSERFVVSEGLVPPTDMPWREVATALEDERYFLERVAGNASMPAREIGRRQQAWRAQHGLVDGDDLKRLVWTVHTFHRELEVDLQRVGVDLHALWQSRRWRRLLNQIDHLPRTTWTWTAMANHPDYAANVATAIAAKRIDAIGEDETPSSLVDYSTEASLLMGVIDAINELRATFIRANSKPGAQAPKIPPYPRPRTLVDAMVDKQERMLRWKQHDDLAARLLPGRQ